ncbi:flagellar basal body L-ring protein FlgH [Phenylobacterium sp.]|jgi:flagellar L-ring protein precursor FlgH|uniref:flagellar basal body L-ring protein FlgH n=1 Tax=Phenylobacterium sp. TaxID=1871053 RepID=UPI0008CD961A|nr:flagellar basal body L-ring protein FlgH [Phenylobacterium sp.]MBA4793925.1 flagellar basal body L-ring protein FlgH [Phenylobacterium sp.]OHB36462.1 MAG: flagellar basal body L-ring protein [Phenylobacterium sp. RIFCSPHIGHO2_01_FULL_70_10]
MRLPLLAALALLPLGACSTVHEAVAGPDLTPVRYPAALVPQQQPVILASANQPMATPASANSLWRTGARAFFIDQRANRVGDILTVQIEIDDRAQTSNSTSSSRTSGASAGVPNFLGLESSLGRVLPGGFDPANAISTNSASNNAGSGSVSRAEKISLTIAAVVTAVLPNGNMMIQGTQEVRTNAEVRQLSVAGIVRPEDISSANTIRHTQIAEARISYGGRGDISRVQKTPAGQALVETFSPF